MRLGKLAVLPYQRETVGNRIKEGKKLIQLYVSTEKWEQLRSAADSVEEPITAWIRRSIYASLRNWSNPALKATNWPPCEYCRKKHDPAEHNL